MRLPVKSIGLILAGVLITLRPATALTPVDLELVLGVDISGSVDVVEARLQREGYVAALTNRAVIKAIRSGLLRRIAVTYFEWSDEFTRSVVVGWTLLHDTRSARRFAAAIAGAPAERGRYTSIGGAIDFAVPMFGANNFEGTRRGIDLSGDGPNNVGRLVTEARDAAVAVGITVNGLPIVNDRPNRFGRPMPDLDLYYRKCVIGGPGAFLVMADNFDSFAVAVRRKLILEIAGLAIPARRPHRALDGAHPPGRRSGLLRRVAAPRVAPPCDEGERRLEQRRRDWY